MKKSLVILVTTIVIVLLAVCAILFFFNGNNQVNGDSNSSNSSNSNSSVDYIGQEIEFSKSADVMVDSNTKIEYNIAELRSQLSEDELCYVLYDPKPTDYQIVSKLGFDIDDYSLWDDGTRSYSTEGKDKEKWLLIDQYGCFTYKTGVASTTFEMPLSDKECYDIAKKYLQDLGLYSKRLGTETSLNKTELYSESEGSKMIATGINFLVDNTYGNARIMVEVNGNGDVTSVTYSVREYAGNQNVELISLEEAIEHFEEGKAFVYVENPSSNLKFEKVSIKYWSQETNNDNLFVQPVYYFEGTSTVTNGETEPFTITVQANKYE